ncbi:MAG: hypothetical protein AAFX93_04220 [Verrucomicrobiota bacterium]
MKLLVLSLISLTLIGCTSTPTPEQQKQSAELRKTVRTSEEQLEKSGQIPAADQESSIRGPIKENYYIDL